MTWEGNEIDLINRTRFVNFEGEEPGAYPEIF